MGDNLNNHEEIEVFFCLPSFNLIPLRKPEDKKVTIIIINPLLDGWNDFHNRISCTYTYRNYSKSIHHKGNIFVGFLEKEETDIREYIKEVISEKVKYISLDKMPKLFTMQPNIEDYRQCVATLGLAEVKRFLLGLNDLVALRHYKNTPDWFAEAMQTNVFKFAFMRRSEPFFTFHNASYILDGLKEESLTSISNQFSLSFKLNNFHNKHIINFDFDQSSVVPKRINVLIGKNGLGKSQALHNIIIAASHGDDGINILKDKKNARVLINRILAIGTPGETSNSFPEISMTKSKVFYQRLAMTRNNHSAISINNVLLQLVRSGESIKGESRWQIFIDSISSILSLDNIYIELKDKEHSSFSLKEKFYISLSGLKSIRNEQTSLEIWNAISEIHDPMLRSEDQLFSLSSGQLTFFRFVAQACLYIENGTLLLIDEPETHLHPNLISDFIEVLDQLLSMTGSICILATHSVYFVREVPREQVFVFQEREQSINIVHPRIKTFGADIGAISFFVFGEETVNNLIYKVKDYLKGQPKQRHTILKELEDQLAPEVIMALKRELNITDEKN